MELRRASYPGLTGEVLTFGQAIDLLASRSGAWLEEMPMELNVALALPLNAVATHFRSQPNATRTQLLEAACDPYVREIVAACRGDFATTVLAADALAVSFEVGRVVQDTADRDRLCLLPNPDAPEAFRRLLDCIIQKLPSRTHGRAATKNDPSYA